MGIDLTRRLVIIIRPVNRLTTASIGIRGDNKSVYNCIYTRFGFYG